MQTQTRLPALLLLTAASLARAGNVTLASLFLGDAVVLQAGRGGARVWGVAAPGASVRLTLDGVPAGVSVASSTGNWEALLPEQPPSWHIAKLRASDVAGGGVDAQASLRFGTVMLCSGQRCVAAGPRSRVRRCKRARSHARAAAGPRSRVRCSRRARAHAFVTRPPPPPPSLSATCSSSSTRS